jgi:hypothetical protein
MRFVSYLVSLTLIGLCSTRVMGQTMEPEQKDGTAKGSEIWEGKFADGTPLTQKRLEELRTAHRAWRLTTDQKLEEQCGKAKVKVQDRKTCRRELLASDWGAHQGRLVLRGADLWGVNLEGANLGNANLEGAKLWNANLEGALYEPKLGRLPEIVSLGSAENLEMMRFGTFPHALEDLRREFKKVGFKEQERQITYAIKRSEQLNARERRNLIEPFFNYVFFDLPVAYGLRPDGRYGSLFR